jgi:solute carrier family 25 oxoglutarate transporter 11
MAFYADKTFPKELQRGYTSYFNALRRIPFEEGTYYLFKNTFPFIARNFFQTLTMLFAYDYLKDKLGWLTYRLTNNWPVDLTKFM